MTDVREEGQNLEIPCRNEVTGNRITGDLTYWANHANQKNEVNEQGTGTPY